MACRELAEYVMDQLAGLNVRSLPMMGGWLFYIDDRVFGGIYDSGNVMVKRTAASLKHMPDAVEEPPYPGAKPMLTVTILDDRERFRAMVAEMANELPAPKPRKGKGARTRGL